MRDTSPRRLSQAAPGGPAEPVAPERLRAGSPVTRVANAYSSGDGRFHAGVWESTVGRWRVSYTEHEVCVLIAGRVRLIEADGRATEFTAPEAFLIPAGFEGDWETLEPARKLYVIYQP